MNVTTMVARLRERLGNPSTSDVSDATLLNRINEAAEFIWDRYRFHANRSVDTSITTVAGTASYALPSGCDVIMGVKDTTNSLKLKKIGKDVYDEKEAIVEGKPTEYFRQGDNIILWTTPDDAYAIRIRYKAAFTALTDPGTCTLPASWHTGIVALARFMHWDTIGDVPKAQYAYRMWKEWLDNKSNEIDEEIQQDFDQAVRVPTLEQAQNRLDFDHAD